MNISGTIEIGVGILLVLFAIIAVFSKKPLKSIIFLSILSMLAVIAFAILRAPDVAVTEAVIGSGLVTFIFLITLKTSKKAGGDE